MATIKNPWKGGKLTPVQIMVLSYLFFLLLGTVLLSLPVSLQPGVKLPPIDALFTAASAISVTGLTVVSTPETFSNFGLAILLVWLQFGGIGIMTLGTLMYLVLGRQISLRNRMLIRADQNQTTMAGMVILMKFILKLALALESIAAIILTAHFYFSYDYNFLRAIKYGVFHAISSFTNAGFDLFGNSLRGLPQDYLIHTVIGLMIICGAIGFPVLLEVRSWMITGRRRFSLFTKVTSVTFFALVLLGFFAVFFGESNAAMAGLPWQQKISVALFQSISTRSGGLSTYDITEFRTATILFFCMLMFIGGSPSSCGGGIRTTTFAVILMSLYSFSWKGRDNVQAFGRELYHHDIQRAFSVFTLAIIIVFFATVAILELEQNFSATQVLFEVCSAFGTTGLSLEITSELTDFSKLIIIALMFIGRIGLVALLLLPQRPKRKQKYHYVKEKIIIG
ncbi:potassium transporter TrkG [Peptococcaceae bacterium 1198_IL3148]